MLVIYNIIYLIYYSIKNISIIPDNIYISQNI